MSTVSQYTGALPGKNQSELEFNANVTRFLAYVATLAPQLNQAIQEVLAGANVSLWVAGTTYYPPRIVAGSDGLRYSLTAGAGVIGDNPVGSVTGRWVKLFMNLDDFTVYPLPTGVTPTGTVVGLDYSRTGDHEVTIQPGYCRDETNLQWLRLASAQVLSSIPVAAGGLYHLFLCSDGVVRQDTSVTGANLSAYQIGYIGYVQNTAGEILRAFRQKGKLLCFNKSSEGAFASGVQTTSFVSYDYRAFVPVTRVDEVLFGARGNTNPGTDPTLSFSLDGVNTDMSVVAVSVASSGDAQISAWGVGGSNQLFMPCTGTIYVKGNATDSTAKLVHAVMLRR